MKAQILLTSLLLFLLNTNLVVSQEWNNLKSYQKETGKASLDDGCWLKKDRQHHNAIWSKANLFNLSVENGDLKYKTISQIRDFYEWFDLEREKQGHDIEWIKIAGTVARQLSKVDCGLIRTFIVRNKEVVAFSNEGSKKVFAFAFPQLKEVYYSSKLIKGKAAKDWDSVYGMKEQCVVLEPLYQKLSSKALWKLDRMAKGKGVFIFGVCKKWRFVGSIEDCKTRFEHGKSKIQ
ncbi:hypothetical protein [Flavobacterium sp.]|uniref:hypothetical protein n=1 Tax=Flavobacterium sp. TaxID=239 RepID=UPI00261FB635|nr:hypothetical protein [Flavobacterium sp.]